jgi:uncharacterized protein (DUF4415 family)
MRKLTERQSKEIRSLRLKHDSAIDLSDIPEQKSWSQAEVGKFFRPVKVSVTIRLDADVLARLKQMGKGYQTRINTILREAVERPR